MNALMTLFFKDEPVRIEDRNGEPWFVGKDVCRCLALKNHIDALSRLDDDETDGVGITDPIGRIQNTTIISLPGAFRLVFSSRVKKAEEFKRWLAHDVLIALGRSGQYGAPGAELYRIRDDQHREDIRLNLTLVNECRRTWGKHASQRMWRSMPELPQVEDQPVLGQGFAPRTDGPACLARLLMFNGGPEGEPMADMILRAQDDRALREEMRESGLYVAAPQWPQHFAVAPENDALDRLFAATEWSSGRWFDALLSLPFAERTPGLVRLKGKNRRKWVMMPISEVGVLEE